MVAGHLREKRGYFHIVLSYTDENGKRQTPSKTTGLPVKGNKKRAEAMLMEARQSKELELKKLRETKREKEDVTPQNPNQQDKSKISFTNFSSSLFILLSNITASYSLSLPFQSLS